jgi:hypothetical protein
MKLLKKLGLLMVVCVALVVTSSVQAGIATDLGHGWTMFVSNGMQPVDVAYVQPGNGLGIELDKTFNQGPDNSGYFSPIIIEFVKTSTDAASKIVITDEYIRNLTGVEWDAFDMQLMVNMFNPQAGFNPVTVDGDQLEDVTYSKYVGFDGKPILLSFTNGQGDGVLSGTFEDPFKPGLVVGVIEIDVNPNAPLYTRIGLKEVPVAMPEPATVMMLGLGGLAMLKKRKQKLC